MKSCVKHGQEAKGVLTGVKESSVRNVKKLCKEREGSSAGNRGEFCQVEVSSVRNQM